MSHSCAPTKHTLLDLNRRVGNLASESRTLHPLDARKIADDLGVSLAEVKQRFAAQLASWDQAAGCADKAGEQSHALRANNQGGSYAGQAVVNATTTPALLGANLKVPGEE